MLADMPPCELPASGEADESLLRLLYQVPIGIVQFDSTGRIELINPEVPRLLMPLLASCADPDNLFSILETCVPDLPHLVGSQALPSGSVCENRRIYIGSLGPAQRTIWASLTVTKISPHRYVGTLTDISELVRQEQRTRLTDAWFAAILQGATGYMHCTVDDFGRVLDWNRSGENLLGWRQETMLGMPIRVIFPPGPQLDHQMRERFATAQDQGWHLSTGPMLTQDGQRFSGDCLVSVLDAEPKNRQYLFIARRLHGEYVEADALVRLATTDHLTGVLNRARLFELAGRQLVQSTQRSEPLSMIMLDLDHFKTINDRFGHPVGDRVLQRFATLCREEIRSIDLLGRIGGEEFLVLLPGCDLEVGRAIAERLRRRIEQEAIRLDEDAVSGPGHIAVTASAGVAALETGETLEQLLRRADRLLYAAKTQGRNCIRAAFAPAS
ncbi:GGDEF domain-containing protein [Indioceanicola profundi]|uniref:GGDEF domain-containing protein n=1 Tax=Indioceanicola profundi TaxID=2220096 RepID=UPI000E6ABEB6|nr:GGDEF domain-containing protein [Indioceanicola profundi]